MAVIRAVWWVLAFLSAAYAFWIGGSSMSNLMSSSCGVEGSLPFGRVAGSTWCDDSVVTVVGLWSPVWLGLLLAVPFVLAALAMRRGASWLVVAALTVLSFVGLANWSTFWGQLLVAIPLAVITLIVATVQHILSEPL